MLAKSGKIINNLGMESIAKIDVESGRLTVAEALAQVETEIEVLKLSGAHVAKIIHGYGSKGVGGEIKKALLQHLKTLKKHKKIEDFFANETFSFTQKKYSFYIKKHPNLVLDEDLKNLNFGITIVFF